MFRRKLLTQLIEWKDSPYRKPLILRGARQVGKTFLLRMFGEENFENTIYINLEDRDHGKLFTEPISLSDFERIIQLNFHTTIVPGKTLIIIDEIQQSKHLLSLLRFFYEEKPEWHVVAAGSLLEAKLKEYKTSFPVGRVTFLYLYPLDFFEFLVAKGEEKLLKELKELDLNNKPKIPNYLHNMALEKFYEYTMIGGMPEAVAKYVATGNLLKTKEIYASLLTTYADDIYKYAGRGNNAKHLLHVLDNAPLFAGSIIKYEGFGGSGYKSREMSEAFYMLQRVMLLYQAEATSSKELPLLSKVKRPKKLIFLDVGFSNYVSDLFGEYIGMKDLNDFYRGRIAEQVIGQNILAQYSSTPPNIYYWAKEREKGSAEVDFCFAKEGKIVGVEVKSGSGSKLQSLKVFDREVNNNLSLRFYDGDLDYNKYTSVPFYLIPRIMDFIEVAAS